LWEQYGEEVQFYVVYISEAHALDGFSPLGGGEHPIVEEPSTQVERDAVAKVCMTKLALDPMPALVDDLQDTANLAYKAHPDRLYLIGKDGNIAFHGFEGPMGFNPDDLEDAIEEELALN